MTRAKVDPSLVAAIDRADSAIRPDVLETPVTNWKACERNLGGRVLIKQENLQRTGSFKLRGAKMAIVTGTDQGRKIVTASSGNHGAGIAHALSASGQIGTIFLPETVERSKYAALKSSGQDLRIIGADSAETEFEARRWAAANGARYISPYNDLDVIAGQGTIGNELLRQTKGMDVVYVAVGGGGLISGVATALKARLPNVTIVGCSPENSCVMHTSVKAGEILDLPSLPTFSDGTAGGLEPGTITFDYCRTLVDEWITVSEVEISQALRLYIDDCHQLVEGSAAVAFAAMIKHANKKQSDEITRVAIACGANIGSQRLREVLDAAS